MIGEWKERKIGIEWKVVRIKNVYVCMYRWLDEWMVG